jgi:hypothetical protein
MMKKQARDVCFEGRDSLQVSLRHLIRLMITIRRDQSFSPGIRQSPPPDPEGCQLHESYLRHIVMQGGDELVNV